MPYGDVQVIAWSSTLEMGVSWEDRCSHIFALWELKCVVCILKIHEEQRDLESHLILGQRWAQYASLGRQEELWWARFHFLLLSTLLPYCRQTLEFSKLQLSGVNNKGLPCSFCDNKMRECRQICFSVSKSPSTVHSVVITSITHIIVWEGLLFIAPPSPPSRSTGLRVTLFQVSKSGLHGLKWPYNSALNKVSKVKDKACLCRQREWVIQRALGSRRHPTFLFLLFQPQASIWHVSFSCLFMFLLIWSHK